MKQYLLVFLGVLLLMQFGCGKSSGKAPMHLVPQADLIDEDVLSVEPNDTTLPQDEGIVQSSEPPAAISSKSKTYCISDADSKSHSSESASNINTAGNGYSIIHISDEIASESLKTLFASANPSLGEVIEQYGLPDKISYTSEGDARHYFKQGFQIDVFYQCDDPVLCNFVYLSPTCELKIAKGIGIGSTRGEVLEVFGTKFVGQESPISSVLEINGLYIILKNNVVHSIYIAFGAGSMEYLSGFFPDREIGFPLDVQAVYETTNSKDGLFYLGQPKEMIMSLVSYYNVQWKEFTNDSGCGTVIADEFIFIFDMERKLSCVAVDRFIMPRYTTKATSKGIGIQNSQEGAKAYYGSDYVHSFCDVDDLLPDYGHSYDKYTYDFGTHDFFICTTRTSNKIIRWGICVKNS